MHSVLLTDWITIRGTDTTPVVQSAEDWLDVPDYADAVFWVEVTQVTNPGSGTLALLFETAPADFERLFVTLDSVDVLTVGPAPVLRKAFLNQVANVPLARFLRWKLVGSAAGTWSVTFRVHVTLGEGVRSAMSPRALPGLLLWFRADVGLTLQAGNAVSTWQDQSGLSNHFVSQGTGALQPTWVPNAIGGRPALDFSGGKYLENTFNNPVTPDAAAYSVLAVAKNGNGTFFSLRRSAAYSASMFFLNIGGNTYVYSNGSANVSVANTLPETQSASAAFKSCHRYAGSGVAPRIWLNATERNQTAGTVQGDQTGSTGFQVGTNSQGVPEPWNGLIAELIVVSGAISDLDRRRIEIYQRNFFGV
ncbi:MAG: hypothetical protein IPG50_34435 [Myxococcales bacterium]|nr:hypothetical protein [Myxococcales bacterium]